MPIQMGSNHVRVRFMPGVENLLRELSVVQFRILRGEEGDEVVPFKMFHYLRYCRGRAEYFSARQNYKTVAQVRFPAGTWTLYTGGFTFHGVKGLPRNVGIFDEPFNAFEVPARGTLVLTETRPDVWIASWKIENGNGE